MSARSRDVWVSYLRVSTPEQESAVHLLLHKSPDALVSYREEAANVRGSAPSGQPSVGTGVSPESV